MINKQDFALIKRAFELFFTSLPGFILIIASLQFWFHGTITPYTFPTALLASTLISLLLLKEGARPLLISILVLFSIFFTLLITYWLSHYFFETSKDSFWYHTPTAVLLMQGWNPFDSVF
jgi:hypothetical protein